ncbi:hypothetical protein TNCV_2900841 [Trichonephila clavipes]|nr:hypothetical protein TNCV_2900841 [Trichonephila clavipes]
MSFLTEGIPFPSAQQQISALHFQKQGTFSSVTTSLAVKQRFPQGQNPLFQNTVIPPLHMGEHRQLLKNLPPNSTTTVVRHYSNGISRTKYSASELRIQQVCIRGDSKYDGQNF